MISVISKVLIAYNSKIAKPHNDTGKTNKYSKHFRFIMYGKPILYFSALSLTDTNTYNSDTETCTLMLLALLWWLLSVE